MKSSIYAASRSRARRFALTLAGIAAFSVLPTPALAFEFIPQGQTAGNPSGQSLYRVAVSAADIGQSFTVNWQLAGSGQRADLAASAEFTVVSLNSETLVLDVELTNQTTGSFQAAIMSLGLSVDATLSNLVLATAGTNFSNITPNRNGNFPGGFRNINVCVFASNNCNGGAIFNGLQSGNQGDRFRITLSGDFSSETVTLSSFPIKFQTEAGSYELAGTFESVDMVAEETTETTETTETSESSESSTTETVTQTSTQTSETVVTQTTTTSTEFSQTVSQTIVQQVSQQTNIAASELRIVEVRRQTWPDGCLGLPQPGTACTQALVEGYLVTVASRQNVYVYRTNSTGSLVVLDQARTREYRSARVRRRRVKVSRGVHRSVLRQISQTYQVEQSSLRVTKVQRKHWRNDCLGLPAGPGRGRACGRNKVKGYMLVVTDGQQSWVCRSDRRGSYVVVDEWATQLRRRQKESRRTQQVVRFTDISQTHWAWYYVRELSVLNVIAGYPDGSYRPDQLVTRAELAAIVRRAFEYSEVRQSIAFSDVSTNYWGFQAAQAAYQLGFLDPVTGSAFLPESTLTRAAALLAIANGLEIPKMTNSAAQSVLSNYNDFASLGDAELLLASLVQEGIFVDSSNSNRLNLNQPITRAEVAVLVYQALASLGSVESVPSDYTGGTVDEDDIEVVDDDLLDDFDDLEDIDD